MLNFYFEAERMKHPRTGIYEYCAQLGQAMARQVRADETLSVYVPESVPGTWINGTRRIPQKSWHRFHVPRQRDASLWHSTYQETRYMPRWPIPRLLTVHDLNFLYEPRSQRSLQRHRRRVLKNIRSADHIVAISQFVAADIARNLGAARTPIEVIYNGCDVVFDEAFEEPRYRPSRPFCFTIGPTIPKKNFHVLPCLLRGNELELVIAGSDKDAYSERIRAEAERHGVADRVSLIGPVTHDEKFWYYRNCAAFVFPSIAEGFGLPVIEAMHFGKKVFLSERTSLPEVGGRFATYFTSFDPDAMSMLFDQALAAEVDLTEVAAMIEHAASFNWRSSASKYLDLYRRLAA
jgi:glycosyltransferase involved in cell wall biosynthesis